MGAYVTKDVIKQGIDTLLTSNKGINSAGDAIGTAWSLSMKNKQAAAKGLTGDAAKYMSQFSQDASGNWLKDGKKMGMLDKAEAFMHNADGSYNKTAIAGSYLGLAGGMRLVGGGGLTRDGRGNHDIVGIPFI